MPSMIHSARPTGSPVVNIVFAGNLFCFARLWKVGTYGLTCAKTMFTTGRDGGPAEWINVFLLEEKWAFFFLPKKWNLKKESFDCWKIYYLTSYTLFLQTQYKSWLSHTWKKAAIKFDTTFRIFNFLKGQIIILKTAMHWEYAKIGWP